MCTGTTFPRNSDFAACGMGSLWNMLPKKGGKVFGMTLRDLKAVCCLTGDKESRISLVKKRKRRASVDNVNVTPAKRISAVKLEHNVEGGGSLP